MNGSARPFGLSTGGFDRRVLPDRRSEERRKITVPVGSERRRGVERRSPRGRRITEWFPVQPAQPPLAARPPVNGSEHETEPSEPAAAAAFEAIGADRLRMSTDVFTSHSFTYDQRRYDLDGEDVKDERGRTIDRQWLVTVDGVVEHTLRVLPNEDRESLEQRTIKTIENTAVGAARELDFTFQGKRYRLEDWSGATSPGVSQNFTMWCVTCDGVVEGTFAAPVDESESELRHRAVDIARRSGEFQTVSNRPSRKTVQVPAAPRPSVPRPVVYDEQPDRARSMLILVWIVIGVVAARAVSSLVQGLLLG